MMHACLHDVHVCAQAVVLALDRKDRERELVSQLLSQLSPATLSPEVRAADLSFSVPSYFVALVLASLCVPPVFSSVVASRPVLPLFFAGVL